MPEATLAEPHTESSDKEFGDGRTVIKWFAVILAVSFILRIAYAGHLYQDDGFWFTAAEEMLRGKALYREIYFDKPPGLPMVYTALFWIFGAHILTIRVFTIFYSTAISAVIYLFGSKLYDRRTGLIAAGMFAFFSTTSASGHVQGLNTDLLMALPYTAGAYLLVRSRADNSDRSRFSHVWFAWAGGALAGLAFQINPKGIFDLLFFAFFLIAAQRWPVGEGKAPRARDTATDESADGQSASAASQAPIARAKADRSSASLVAFAIAGFIISALPFLVYLTATHALGAYWLYVWRWGVKYVGYQTTLAVIETSLRYNIGFFALNNTLLITLVFVAAVTIKGMRRLSKDEQARRTDGTEVAPGAGRAVRGVLKSDITLLIWFVTSYAGLTIGGRFYSHYFFQVVPGLCLIGARGLIGITAAISAWRQGLRRAAIALLTIGFLVTVVRFHSRTVSLASDWVRGTKSETTAGWFHERLNSEEQGVAARVRELRGQADVADQRGGEAMRIGGPRTRPADGPADYLFVWGYRPEIYYWSGLLPASRYLSTQPLTGVPADVHYFGEGYRSLLPGDLTAAARVTLVHDLEETRPKYIVDELGFFNSELSIQSSPELREFMTAYKPRGTTGRFFIYLRKEFLKKHRERQAKPD
jgi:hypothetical protein